MAERTRKEEQGLIGSLQVHAATIMNQVIDLSKPILDFVVKKVKQLALSQLLAASEVFSAHLRSLGAVDSVSEEVEAYHQKVLAHPQRDHMTGLELATVSVVCLLAALTIAWLFRRGRRPAWAEEGDRRPVY